MFAFFVKSENIEVNSSLKEPQKAVYSNFNIEVITIDETCRGNGSSQVVVSNTVKNAIFLFTYYKYPDMNNPIGFSGEKISTGTIVVDEYTNGLTSGKYKVVVTETIEGKGSVTKERDFEIYDNRESLDYFLSVEEDVNNCSLGKLVVRALNGTPASYMLLDRDTGDTIVAPQASNEFPNLEPKWYRVSVKDVCGNVLVRDYSFKNPEVSTSASVYMERNVELESCDDIGFKIKSSYTAKASYEPYSVKYTIFKEGVETYEVTKTYTNSDLISISRDSTEKEFPELFYPTKEGGRFRVEMEVTDACGFKGNGYNWQSSSYELVNNPEVSTRYNSCWTKYFHIEYDSRGTKPIGTSTVKFTRYPEGFKPWEYSDAFEEGSYEITLDANTILEEGFSISIGEERVLPSGYYSYQISNSCGITWQSSADLSQINSPELSLRAMDGYCGSKYLRARLVSETPFNFPLTFEFMDAPVGFEPWLYSDLIPEGSNKTRPIEASDLRYFYTQIYFGSEDNALPEGEYKLKVVDACGSETVESIKLVYEEEEEEQYVLKQNYYFGMSCVEGYGVISLGLRSTTTSAVKRASSAAIVAAPNTFTEQLPYYTIPNGYSGSDVFMRDLPAGKYEVLVTDMCGNNYTKEVDVIGMHSSYSKNIDRYCGSFELEVNLETNADTPVLYLQKFYENRGWGDPDNPDKIGGIGVYLENYSKIILEKEGSSSSPFGAVITYTAKNNIGTEGKFRVIFKRNGQESANVAGPCYDVIDEFEIGKPKVNNTYVFQCPNGKVNVFFDAEGKEPMTYKIVEPIVIDNGENPVFANLEPQFYKAEIMDDCGSRAVVNIDARNGVLPKIHGQNMCDGENGALTLPGLDFFNVEWRKEGSGTVLKTNPGESNILRFEPYNKTVDAGVYIAKITGSNSCISAVEFRFELKENSDLPPNAGEGGTYTVEYPSEEKINLFDYLEGDYDTHGNWEELTTEGLLNDSFWDISKVSVGEYKFKYTVNGICSGSDEAIITLNYKSNLVANEDVFIVCPREVRANIGNVMENDLYNGVKIDTADYKVSYIAEPWYSFTISPDGTIGLPEGLWPREEYILEYRVESKTDPNIFAYGTLKISDVEDRERPQFVGDLPEDVTVSCDEIPDPPVITVIDNSTCGEATLRFTEEIYRYEDEGCEGSYFIDREWFAIDPSFNSIYHFQVITVIDTKAPEFVGDLPEDITVSSEDIPEAPTLSAVDQCTTATVTYDETITEGVCPENYTITRKWTATDECELTKTHTQTITVQGIAPPEFIEDLPQSITVSNESEIPAPTILTATDNSEEVPVVYEEKRSNSDSCPGSYVITREWTATNRCESTTTHIQTITVQDLIAPVITSCPEDFEIANCEMDKIPAGDISLIKATDNETQEDDLIITYDDVDNAGTGTVEDPYVVLRTYTVEDLCGNKTECIQQITCIGKNTLPEVLGETDIRVTNSTNIESTQVGEKVVFTVTVTNLGTIEATNVVVVDELAAGYSYIKSKVTKGNYDRVTGAYTIPSLMPNETVTLTITVEITSINDYTNEAMLVSLDQKDVNPLNDKATSMVYIQNDCFQIFNELTPNGDGKNDYFKIQCIDNFPNHSIKVYNRWGVEVFTTRNYQNNWSGTLQKGGVGSGKQLSKGTYYYVVDLGDGTKARTGWLHIN